MRLPLLALAALAACAAPQPRMPGPIPPDPPLLAAVPAGHTGYSNASLAELFVTLTHETEWGGEQARLVRLEPPVTVTLEGPGAERYRGFVADYLAFLRREAGIEIGLGATGANLRLRFVPGQAFERLLPAASCVVVPEDLDWDTFAKAPSALGGLAMLDATDVAAFTVFIPDSAIPADIRRCLLEEIAQSLGPRNDLYGLGSSIFNDDFGHLWPTRLDLLMLRVLYAPGLRTGLTRRESERAARKALRTLNPAGRSAPALPDPEQQIPEGWRTLVGKAANRTTSKTAREQAATDALALARTARRRSPALCQSLTTLATLLRLTEPERAERLFAEADRACAASHGDEDPRRLSLAVARAGLALSQADAARALALTDGVAEGLAAHGLDEALASVYAIRQRAFDALNRPDEATRAAALARVWGTYAFGRDPGPWPD
ncbi:MAG: DUF2927 domain-containing protein [Pseudomonadota bacterium]